MRHSAGLGVMEKVIFLSRPTCNLVIVLIELTRHLDVVGRIILN